MKRKKETIVEADITGIAFGGRGIARLDGMAVFVDGAVPGDRAMIRITRRKRSYAEARLVEILSPSADRIAAPCRYSGFCGGCTWQFLRYDRQLDFKRRHVAESLEHIGGLKGVEVHPTLPSPGTFAYRNKMEFTCADRRWLLPEELDDPGQSRDFAVGLHVPGTFHKVIDIRECLLQPELGNRILAETREFMRSSARPVYGLRSHEGFWRFAMLRSAAAGGRWMVNLVTAFEDRPLLGVLAQRLVSTFPEIVTVVNNVTARRAGVAVGEFERTLAGAGVIREAIGRYEFEISANSFFQTNTRGAEGLYATVRDFARLEGGETVLDLYSGTGTIPILLSERCREVVGMEISESAVADAIKNCRLNGVDNCRFLQGDIRERLPGAGLRPEVAIIDPPRVGMHETVVRELLALAPHRLVYVSCNPATLARDAAMLAEGYDLEEVQPVDMFPHTFHVEAVARLVRRAAPSGPRAEQR
jgi:23S rRNA (uracil1939-C5)-methyltransferase